MFHLSKEDIHPAETEDATDNELKKNVEDPRDNQVKEEKIFSNKKVTIR